MKIRVWVFEGSIFRNRADATTAYWDGGDGEDCSCSSCQYDLDQAVRSVDLETSDYEIIDGDFSCEKS